MFFHGIFLPWVRRAGLWLFWPALAVVVWGELTPHPPSVVNHFWDKSQHFIAYFGLALLATLGWGPAALAGPGFPGRAGDRRRAGTAPDPRGA